MNLNSYCVIMAGGIGNRFWPVSNQHCPKQFSDILHTGKSFIRQTYERISQIFPNDHIFVITGEEYGKITRKELPEVMCATQRPVSLMPPTKSKVFLLTPIW